MLLLNLSGTLKTLMTSSKCKPAAEIVEIPDSLQEEDVWLHNNLPEKMILRDHLDVLVLLTLMYVPKLRPDSPANVKCWAKKEAPVAPAETNRNRQCKVNKEQKHDLTLFCPAPEETSEPHTLNGRCHTVVLQQHILLEKKLFTCRPWKNNIVLPLTLWWCSNSSYSTQR